MDKKEKEQEETLAQHLGFSEERWEFLGATVFGILSDFEDPYFHDGQVIETIMQLPDLTEKERVACAYKIAQLLSETEILKTQQEKSNG